MNDHQAEALVSGRNALALKAFTEENRRIVRDLEARMETLERNHAALSSRIAMIESGLGRLRGELLGGRAT